jgi:hypothetical protein
MKFKIPEIGKTYQVCVEAYGNFYAQLKYIGMGEKEVFVSLDQVTGLKGSPAEHVLTIRAVDIHFVEEAEPPKTE